MKIAVLSDTHDNIWNLEKVLKRVKKEKCKAIIFCGDYCASFIVKSIAKLKLPTYAVFGNIDGTHYEIASWLTENAPHYKQFRHLAEIELGKKKMAITHYPEFAEGLACTGKYDAVFHGQKKVGKTLLANPGEILAAFSKCTFGVYDTKSGKFQIVEV
jgi:putative phosphoesterase